MKLFTNLISSFLLWIYCNPFSYEVLNSCKNFFFPFNDSPDNSMQALIRFWKESIKLLITSIGISSQIFWIWNNSSRFVTFAKSILALMMAQRCSIAFRSGELAGQCKSSKSIFTLSDKKNCVLLALWAGAPSCWNAYAFSQFHYY